MFYEVTDEDSAHNRDYGHGGEQKGTKDGDSQRSMFFAM